MARIPRDRRRIMIPTQYWYYELEECERCLWIFQSAVMTNGVCKSCHDARRWILLDDS